MHTSEFDDKMDGHIPGEHQHIDIARTWSDHVFLSVKGFTFDRLRNKYVLSFTDGMLFNGPVLQNLQRKTQLVSFSTSCLTTFTLQSTEELYRIIESSGHYIKNCTRASIGVGVFLRCSKLD